MAGANAEQKDIKGILFDFDGTLLDSFSAHFEAYQIMFARFGIQMTKEQFIGSYSPNWYQTYQAVGLPKEEWNRANSYWLEEAGKRSPDLFPGVKETLIRLRRHYTLSLVTAGSRNRVFNDLERTGIEPLFHAVVTGSDVEKPKPSPEGLELALHKLDMQPSEAIYIGDAYADYEMARAAEVFYLGVASAFTDLGAETPYRRVDSITDLPKFFNKLFAAGSTEKE